MGCVCVITDMFAVEESVAKDHSMASCAGGVGGADTVWPAAAAAAAAREMKARVVVVVVVEEVVVVLACGDKRWIPLCANDI